MERIRAEIERASCFCLVLSEGAARSEWVRRELELALEREAAGRLLLVPLRVDESPAPAPLVERVFADFRGDFEQGLRQILGRIQGAEDARRPGAGRIDSDERYFIHYGIELGRADGQFFLQLDVVSSDIEEEDSVRSQFMFLGNARATPEGFEVEDDTALVELLLRTCAGSFGTDAQRVLVDSSRPVRTKFTIDDEDGEPLVEVKVRVERVGPPGRGPLLFNVGALFGQVCAGMGLEVDDDAHADAP